jgi:hypothetical protein
MCTANGGTNRRLSKLLTGEQNIRELKNRTCIILS